MAYRLLKRLPMSFEAKLESQTATAMRPLQAARLHYREGCNLSALNFLGCFFAASLLLAGMSQVALAEEKQAPTAGPERGPLLLAASITAAPTSTSLSSPTKANGKAGGESINLNKEPQVRPILNVPLKENDLAIVRSLEGLTKGRSSSTTSGALVILHHGGYGQFLTRETIGRSRVSGAGLEDGSWVYLKMSFKF